MTASWALGAKVGIDVLEQVQSSLTVAMIMTPRDKLMTCRSTETAAEIKARNVDHFSYLPVVDEGGAILGLYRAEQWFDAEAPELPIGRDFEPFSENLVIGADAGILDFVIGADDRPTRMVISGHQVAGMISLSDLQQLPVRAALFTLLTSLEIAMSRRIEAEWPDSSDWMGLMSEDRQQKLHAQIAEGKKNDGYVSDIVFTQLVDKATILAKGKLVKCSRNKMESKFRKVRELRDAIAHANHFAQTPSKAREVCQTVRDILEIKRDLMA